MKEATAFLGKLEFQSDVGNEPPEPDVLFQSPRMLEDHFDQTIPADERKRLTDRCACGMWFAKPGNKEMILDRLKMIWRDGSGLPWRKGFMIQEAFKHLRDVSEELGPQFFECCHFQSLFGVILACTTSAACPF